MALVPENYRDLGGSNRRIRKGAQITALAPPEERLTVSVYVRRRQDAPTVGDYNYYIDTPLSDRHTISRAKYAQQQSATSEDMGRVVKYAEELGLKIEIDDPARRLIQVSGSVEQMNEAFGVELAYYESPQEKYRGREGAIHLPTEVADVVEGVFGLDNRRMAKRLNGAGQPSPVTPTDMARAYSFPTPVSGAQGQTIAVLEFSGPTPENSTTGFVQADIDGFITNLNTTAGTALTSTQVIPVSIDGSPNAQSGDIDNVSDSDIEVALDLEIVVSIAQGAQVIAYFAPITEQCWVDALTQIVADTTHDPSALSISWGWSELEADAQAGAGPWPFEWTQAAFTKMTEMFQAAAEIGMTVFASSGGNGSDCQQHDGNAHVIYPGSDPWVISCGGTIVNSLNPLSEGTWNDGAPTDEPAGATGGGISYLVGAVPWQANVDVPASVNPDRHVGCGVPDVSGNASPASGYALWIYGKSTNDIIVNGNPLGSIGGTSAVAPLYAALFGLINASVGRRVGYLNLTLYKLNGTTVFNDINDDVSNAVPWANSDESLGGPSLGYTSGPGWDPCTGLGSINGTALLDAINNAAPAAVKSAASTGAELTPA